MQPAGSDAVSTQLLIDRNQVIDWVQRAFEHVGAAWDTASGQIRKIATRHGHPVPSQDEQTAIQR